MIHGSFGKIITRRGGGRLLGLLLRALHARPPLLVLVLLLLPPRLRRSPPVLLLDIYILHVALLGVHVHVELLARPDVPVGSVINEYLDVAHAFFDAKDTRFANGLLDGIAKDVRR